MERISLTPDLSLSRIVYGLWRLGDSDDTAPERVRDKIAACLDQGISSMDLADIYGGYTTEGVFGDALTPDLRARMEIVTKCDIVAPEGRHAAARVKHYDTSRAHIFASVDHSLRVMRCEVIDLLLLHRPDPLMDPQETGAALDDFAANMAMEYRIASRVLTRPDFAEGVRAVIVDKTNDPKWDPATPEGVSEELLDSIFAPLPADEEWKPL